jgi:hypothetical protein
VRIRRPNLYPDFRTPSLFSLLRVAERSTFRTRRRAAKPMSRELMIINVPSGQRSSTNRFEEIRSHPQTPYGITSHSSVLVQRHPTTASIRRDISVESLDGRREGHDPVQLRYSDRGLADNGIPPAVKITACGTEYDETAHINGMTKRSSGRRI